MPDPEPASVSEATLCARAPQSPRSVSKPLSPPLLLSSVYQVENLDDIEGLTGGRIEGFFYARDGHPNAVQLAGKLAKLEGAEAAVICGSGMGAIAASLLALLGQGDHVVFAEGLYGKTTTLITRELARLGVEHSTFDASRPQTLGDAMTPRTRVVVAETISNPLLRICDFDAISAVTREAGVPFWVDHTFAPLLCRPLDLGANIVIHSLTKLISGHGDVTLGVVAGSRDLVKRAHDVSTAFGQTGSPFDCWLTLRGMTTLSLRAERTSRTALELAKRLEAHPKVWRVHYPGLPSHADHELAKKYLTRGQGAMISFELGGRDEVDRLIRAFRDIPFAPSLGDVETTVNHPCSTSHRSQDPETLKKIGITPGLLRISTGLEDIEDLWRDFDQALAAV